jgi:uncharacterized protein YkwD
VRVAALLMLAAGLLAASPPTASAGPRMDSRERAIVRAVNYHRAEHGLAEVRPSRRLARAADFHSWEMLDTDYFAHESRDGGPFHERVRRYANHRAVGETLAMLDRCGRGSARRIVRSWMGSDGHRAILLSAEFRRIGLGRRTGDYGGSRRCLVTADFGSRR